MEKGLLYFMYGNIQIAKLATTELIKITNDKELKESLLSDLHSFEKFESAVIILKDKQKIKSLNNFVKRNMKLSIKLKTLFNKDTKKICRMLVLGYEKGIESIDKNIRIFSYKNEIETQLAMGYMQLLIDCKSKYNSFV